MKHESAVKKTLCVPKRPGMLGEYVSFFSCRSRGKLALEQALAQALTYYAIDRSQPMAVTQTKY